MPNEESKTIRNIFIIIMLVGLVIFVVGITLSVKMLILDKKGKGSTNATIVDVGESSTYVIYHVKNKTYKKLYNAYSSTYYPGKQIKIYYNKLNPNKSYIASMQYLILIVPGIGIIFLGVSGIGLIYIYMKYYKKYC